MEAQLAEIFERVLRPHHRAGRHVEPVDEARQQEAQSRAAREQRQRGALGCRERPYRRIALQQRAAEPCIGWQRADLILEFESDENWNMSGPIFDNLQLLPLEEGLLFPWLKL